MVRTGVKKGDVAIDLVERGKVQVVAKAADTVRDYEEQEDFDLAGYKSHPLLDVTGRETVWTCVYLPDSPTLQFSGTYDFPESRLARVPVEEANEDLQPVQRQLVVDLLDGLLDAAAGETEAASPDQVERLARSAGLPGSVVDEAVELHEASKVAAGGSD